MEILRSYFILCTIRKFQVKLVVDLFVENEVLKEAKLVAVLRRFVSEDVTTEVKTLMTQMVRL